MRISVNGEMQEIGAETLAELCAKLGYEDMRIATALNGEFIPATRRTETPIKADDRIEIVAPRQGG